MNLFYSIVEFFVTGGPFMYPILLVFALGAAIAVERYVTLTLMRSSNQSAWGKVLPLLVNGEFDEAREVLSNDKSTIPQLLSMGLARQGAVRRREEVTPRLLEILQETIADPDSRTADRRRSRRTARRSPPGRRSDAPGAASGSRGSGRSG